MFLVAALPKNPQPVVHFAGLPSASVDNSCSCACAIDLVEQGSNLYRGSIASTLTD